MTTAGTGRARPGAHVESTFSGDRARSPPTLLPPAVEERTTLGGPDDAVLRGVPDAPTVSGPGRPLCVMRSGAPPGCYLNRLGVCSTTRQVLGQARESLRFAAASVGCRQTDSSGGACRHPAARSSTRTEVLTRPWMSPRSWRLGPRRRPPTGSACRIRPSDTTWGRRGPRWAPRRRAAHVDPWSAPAGARRYRRRRVVAGASSVALARVGTTVPCISSS